MMSTALYSEYKVYKDMKSIVLMSNHKHVSSVWKNENIKKKKVIAVCKWKVYT